MSFEEFDLNKEATRGDVTPDSVNLNPTTSANEALYEESLLHDEKFKVEKGTGYGVGSSLADMAMKYSETLTGEVSLDSNNIPYVEKKGTLQNTAELAAADLEAKRAQNYATLMTTEQYPTGMMPQPGYPIPNKYLEGRLNIGDINKLGEAVEDAKKSTAEQAIQNAENIENQKKWESMYRNQAERMVYDTETGKERVAKTGETFNLGGETVAGISESMGQMIPGLAVSVVNPVAGLGMLGATSGADEYSSLRAEGVRPEDAFAPAAIAALAEPASDVVFMGLGKTIASPVKNKLIKSLADRASSSSSSANRVMWDFFKGDVASNVKSEYLKKSIADKILSTTSSADIDKTVESILGDISKSGIQKMRPSNDARKIIKDIVEKHVGENGTDALNKSIYEEIVNSGITDKRIIGKLRESINEYAESFFEGATSETIENYITSMSSDILGRGLSFDEAVDRANSQIVQSSLSGGIMGVGFKGAGRLSHKLLGEKETFTPEYDSDVETILGEGEGYSKKVNDDIIEPSENKTEDAEIEEFSFGDDTNIGEDTKAPNIEENKDVDFVVSESVDSDVNEYIAHTSGVKKIESKERLDELDEIIDNLISDGVITDDNIAEYESRFIANNNVDNDATFSSDEVMDAESNVDTKKHGDSKSENKDTGDAEPIVYSYSNAIAASPVVMDEVASEKRAAVKKDIAMNVIREKISEIESLLKKKSTSKAKKAKLRAQLTRLGAAAMKANNSESAIIGLSIAEDAIAKEDGYISTKSFYGKYDKNSGVFTIIPKSNLYGKSQDKSFHYFVGEDPTTSMKSDNSIGKIYNATIRGDKDKFLESNGFPFVGKNLSYREILREARKIREVKKRKERKSATSDNTQMDSDNNIGIVYKPKLGFDIPALEDVESQKQVYKKEGARLGLKEGSPLLDNEAVGIIHEDREDTYDYFGEEEDRIINMITDEVDAVAGDVPDDVAQYLTAELSSKIKTESHNELNKESRELEDEADKYENGDNKAAEATIKALGKLKWGLSMSSIMDLAGSKFREYIFEPLVRARNNEIRASHRLNDDIRKYQKDSATKKKLGKELNEDFSFVDSKGQSINLTLGTAMTILRANPKNSKYIDANGYVHFTFDSSPNKGLVFILTKEDLSSLQDRIRNTVDDTETVGEFLRLLDESSLFANKLMRKKWALDLITGSKTKSFDLKDKNHLAIKTKDLSISTKENTSSDPTTSLRHKYNNEFSHSNAELISFVIEPLNRTVDYHNSLVSKIVAYDVALRKVNSLLNEREIVTRDGSTKQIGEGNAINSLTRIVGEELSSSFSDMFFRFREDAMTYRPAELAHSLPRMLRSLMYVKALGFNLVTAARQLPSAMYAYSKLGLKTKDLPTFVRDFNASFTSRLSSKLSRQDSPLTSFYRQFAPQMYDRDVEHSYDMYSKEVNEAGDVLDRTKRHKIKSGINKMQRFSLMPMGLMDMVAVDTISRSVLRQVFSTKEAREIVRDKALNDYLSESKKLSKIQADMAKLNDDFASGKISIDEAMDRAKSLTDEQKKLNALQNELINDIKTVKPQLLYEAGNRITEIVNQTQITTESLYTPKIKHVKGEGRYLTDSITMFFTQQLITSANIMTEIGQVAQAVRRGDKADAEKYTKAVLRSLVSISLVAAAHALLDDDDIDDIVDDKSFVEKVAWKIAGLIPGSSFVENLAYGKMKKPIDYIVGLNQINALLADVIGDVHSGVSYIFGDDEPSEDIKEAMNNADAGKAIVNLQYGNDGVRMLESLVSLTGITVGNISRFFDNMDNRVKKDLEKFIIENRLKEYPDLYDGSDFTEEGKKMILDEAERLSVEYGDVRRLRKSKYLKR